MFEFDRDSYNDAEEDEISLKERTYRSFDDMYLSDILLLIDVSKTNIGLFSLFYWISVA